MLARAIPIVRAPEDPRGGRPNVLAGAVTVVRASEDSLRLRRSTEDVSLRLTSAEEIVKQAHVLPFLLADVLISTVPDPGQNRNPRTGFQEYHKEVDYCISCAIVLKLVIVAAHLFNLRTLGTSPTDQTDVSL